MDTFRETDPLCFYWLSGQTEFHLPRLLPYTPDLSFPLKLSSSFGEYWDISFDVIRDVSLVINDPIMSYTRKWDSRYIVDWKEFSTSLFTFNTNETKYTSLFHPTRSIKWEDPFYPSLFLDKKTCYSNTGLVWRKFIQDSTSGDLRSYLVLFLGFVIPFPEIRDYK